VASQIGLATLMLGGSALLLRSLDRLTREDGGYTSDHLMVLWYTINGTRYNDNQKILGLGDRILERLRSVPGITATPIYIPPLLGETFLRGKFTLPGETGASAEARSLVLMEFVGSDFFKVFDIPIVRGRGFTEADNLGSEKVIVVSESVAQRYFPGQDPIGKRLMNRDSVTTIIGVARDARLRDIRHTTPMIFVPWHQGGFQGGFAIRTPRPLASVSSELRAAGLAADPSSQLWSMHSMDELLSEPMAKARISALLMSAFSGVALLLAAIGLYGVMTSLVRDRTREIGIRVALGAASGRVRREVLGRAAVVIVVGATVGLVVTLATSGVLQSLLFNVSPTDPISLGGATLLLVLVGLVAAYLPARRATRIDPVQALRSE
jgi:predicted permease